MCGGNVRQLFYKSELSWRCVCEVFHFYMCGSPAVASLCPKSVFVFFAVWMQCTG
jgi:hypothetical protein